VVRVGFSDLMNDHLFLFGSEKRKSSSLLSSGNIGNQSQYLIDLPLTGVENNSDLAFGPVHVELGVDNVGERGNLLIANLQCFER
jgi:hypothetical protein